MNFSCARPAAFFAILLIIPVAVFNCSRLKKIAEKKKLIVRTALHSISFCMLIFAFADLSWGSYLVPVQKSGSSVGFVFDISHSMKAEDGPEGISRLEASALYAKKLLEKMNGSSVCVVLAKGDGIAAIPLTEDFVLIESLLEVLNPSLMTAPGSRLGKGILCAKEALNTNFSAAGRIWLFTDGEETDSGLQNALGECIKSSIPVSIVGFGKENEIPVIAGDGKTVVPTALRKEAILKAISETEKRFSSYENQPQLEFINSEDKDSARKLLSPLKITTTTAYETKPIPQYPFFLVLALLFFAAGFVFSEFNFFILRKSTPLLMILIFLPPLITGCNQNKKDVLKGVYAYNQQDYQHSISLFMEAARLSLEAQNQTAADFCLYDLGTAYLKLDEDRAAMEKFSGISEDAPEAVKYCAFYNAGVIAHKNADYEKAAEFFKKALEADSSKIDAKINLELSIRQQDINVKNNQSKTSPSSEDKNSNSELEKAVFKRIKENDKKQWKNSEQSQEKNLSGDF